MSYVPVFRVQLVKDGRIQARPQLTNPVDVVKILQQYLAGADREHLVVVMLDIRLRIIGINTVAIGTLDASLVSAREVFKPAILANAAMIIVAHNHPSGDVEASPEDIEVAKKLVQGGQLLDIDVADFIIVGEGYKSLKTERLI